jgi:hypothetical protein
MAMTFVFDGDRIEMSGGTIDQMCFDALAMWGVDKNSDHYWVQSEPYVWKLYLGSIVA